MGILYLPNDCETGGFKGTSLLTACFQVRDEAMNKLDELNLAIKPEDGIYNVTAEALRINKINLIEHDKTALLAKAAAPLLYEFLKKWSENGKNKLVPLGHNVAFDIEKYKEQLIAERTWLTFVSYRLQCTGVIGEFLKKKGKIPRTVSGSLPSYCEFFGIPYVNGHTASGDTDMTVEVYKKMEAL